MLRLAIILMGLQVQTSFFDRGGVLLIAAVAAAALPSTFFIAHGLGAALSVRRPMVDLLAAGTMICGASAVNAVAPVARAHREEQATAIAVISLFSIAALIVFRPIAMAVGLESSCRRAVERARGERSLVGHRGRNANGRLRRVMAAASKSARVLLLAPALVSLSLLRRESGPVSLQKSIRDTLPLFLVGYVALAVLRAAGDRVIGDNGTYRAVLGADRFLVDLSMATVSAGMGLHLALGRLLSSSPRASSLAVARRLDGRGHPRHDPRRSAKLPRGRRSRRSRGPGDRLDRLPRRQSCGGAK